MDERFDLPTVGEILVEEFLEPLNITSYRLSKDLGGFFQFNFGFSSWEKKNNR